MDWKLVMLPCRIPSWMDTQPFHSLTLNMKIAKASNQERKKASDIQNDRLNEHRWVFCAYVIVPITEQVVTNVHRSKFTKAKKIT